MERKCCQQLMYSGVFIALFTAGSKFDVGLIFLRDISKIFLIFLKVSLHTILAFIIIKSFNIKIYHIFNHL